MMTGDYVKYSDGSSGYGMIGRIYIIEDGDDEGQEAAVVHWRSGWHTNTKLSGLTVIPRPAECAPATAQQGR